MISAEKNKGKMKAKFTERVWKLMGKRRNGWYQVLESGGVREDLGDDAGPSFKKLIEQAKGFVKDNKLDEALLKYNEALEIKATAPLKAAITKLKNQISSNEMEENADLAVSNGDYDTAIELYKAAESTHPSKQLETKILETESKLKGSKK